HHWIARSPGWPATALAPERMTRTPILSGSLGVPLTAMAGAVVAAGAAAGEAAGAAGAAGLGASVGLAAGAVVGAEGAGRAHAANNAPPDPRASNRSKRRRVIEMLIKVSSACCRSGPCSEPGR